jgi:sulfide:quinone oxidoreductase
VVDAGNGGMAIKTDRVFGGGKTHVTSGPHAHWGKVAFEKAFLLSRKRGSVAF